jgi:hypothetical protein
VCRILGLLINVIRSRTFVKKVSRPRPGFGTNDNDVI